MGKFMKYEIKGSYKFILGALALVMILIVGNFFLLNTFRETRGIVMAVGIFVSISSFLIFGTYITLFFYIVNQFRNDLYEDRGYLTFTIPLSSRQMLLSKALVAFMWFVVIMIGFILGMTVGGLSMVPGDILNEIITNIKNLNQVTVNIDIPSLLYSLAKGFANGMLLLFAIYFSMTLGRVSIKNKKFKGIWFVVFIAFMILYSYISFRIGFASPAIKISTMVSINIGMVIFQIVTILALFFGTSYLIEHKMEI